MTSDERKRLLGAVQKIPCLLSVVTDRGNGAAWLGCRECPRCLLLQALYSEDPFPFIEERIAQLPDNGGYRLRQDLKARSADR